jgi:pyrimidine operon attenuation protein/uracil phosphoribosyltransferase
MTQTDNIILDKKQIDHKIRRIAYQIYENNVSEKEVIIAGIFQNGFLFAQKIKTVLEKIAPIKVTMCKVIIDKKIPTSPIKTSLNPEEYKNKSLVLVDDVLHSGTTLIYGIKHFLGVPLKRFNTVVLVDRNHKKYPVKADFKGISLSTSINENISVIFEKENYFARLD